MTHHKHAAHKIKYPWTKIRLKKACKRIRLRHSALSHNTRKTCNINWQEQRLWQSKKPCFATHIGIKNGILNCKKLPSQCKKSIYGKAFCRKLHPHTPRLTIKKGTNHTHFSISAGKFTIFQIAHWNAMAQIKYQYATKAP